MTILIFGVILLVVGLTLVLGTFIFWTINRNIDDGEYDLPETILDQVKSGQRSTYDGLVTYEKET